jgi:hypothetical protein
MSLIDTTFGPLAPRLLKKWGQPIEVIFRGKGTLDTVSGSIEVPEIRVTTTAVVTKVTVDEVQGLGQAADVKIYINPQDLPAGAVISQSEEVVIPPLVGNFAGQQAKVVDARVVRGQGALLWIVMARFQ